MRGDEGDWNMNANASRMYKSTDLQKTNATGSGICTLRMDDSETNATTSKMCAPTVDLWKTNATAVKISLAKRNLN